MPSDTDMASTAGVDARLHAESSQARKVHWNLERAKSTQGAMDTRTLNRKEDKAAADRHARKQKRRSDAREFGRGRVEAGNERDRMDEHEAREERLRRERRQARRRKEERERREREREHEVAVDDAETSSLEEHAAGTKKDCSGSKDAGMSSFLTRKIALTRRRGGYLGCCQRHGQLG